MAWARVDDGWWCHPKVLALSPASRGVWISALSWSCAQRRDTVPAHLLTMIGGSKDEANALVDAGLWIAAEGGWKIHDWEEYQVRSLSEKRADAGRKGGEASGEVRRAKQSGSNDQASDEAGTQPNPTQPEKTCDDGVAARFEAEVWEPYPRRNGKRVGKKAALAKYRKLSEKRRGEVAQSVKRYAAAVNAGQTIARDCERFLANDWWQDWLAVDDASPNGMKLVNGVWRQA